MLYKFLIYLTLLFPLSPFAQDKFEVKSNFEKCLTNKNLNCQYENLKLLFSKFIDRDAKTLFYLSDVSYSLQKYNESAEWAIEYKNLYRDQIQPYALLRRAMVALDPDTSKGLAIQALDEYSSFLLKNFTSQSLGKILENHAYKFYYYLIKAKNYSEAYYASLDILDLDPKNEYALRAKNESERLLKASGIKVKDVSTRYVSFQEKVKNNQITVTTNKGLSYHNNEIVIPYTTKNGVKYIKGKILGNELDFIFDTGASLVSISLTELLYFTKNKPDGIEIIEKSKAQIADGSFVDSYIVKIKEIQVGEIVLNNVLASSSTNIEAPLLLGNSVIDRLGDVTIEQEKMLIRVKRKN